MPFKSLFFFLLLFFNNLPASSTPTAKEIFTSINVRLGYMEDVALFKTFAHLPVEDLQREQRLLNITQASAAQHGLDPDSIKQFFAVQIAIAKAIQYRYRADWQTNPASRKPLDLQTQIRPALIQLGEKMIREIAAYCKLYGHFNPLQLNTFENSITEHYVTKKEKRLLFEALLKITVATPD